MSMIATDDICPLNGTVLISRLIETWEPLILLGLIMYNSGTKWENKQTQNSTKRKKPLTFGESLSLNDTYH